MDEFMQEPIEQFSAVPGYHLELSNGDATITVSDSASLNAASMSLLVRSVTDGMAALAAPEGDTMAEFEQHLETLADLLSLEHDLEPDELLREVKGRLEVSEHHADGYVRKSGELDAARAELHSAREQIKQIRQAVEAAPRSLVQVGVPSLAERVHALADTAQRFLQVRTVLDRHGVSVPPSETAHAVAAEFESLVTDRKNATNRADLAEAHNVKLTEALKALRAEFISDQTDQPNNFMHLERDDTASIVERIDAALEA
jgi:hypothetical protein